MKTDDFSYQLPPELIAQSPAPKRTEARMMAVFRETNTLLNLRVSDLPGFLRGGDLLVLNDTRVIPSRLFGRKKPSYGRVETLLVEEISPGVWEALLRGRNMPPGAVFDLAHGSIEAEVLSTLGGGRVTLRLKHSRPLMEILSNEGVTPLPPYIKRPPGSFSAEDSDRYQTVYAKNPGAVAAPTAGLHFTEELLEDLARAGVRRADITLHVGPGTFKPVTASEVEEHRMESERFFVPETSASLIRQTKAGGGSVVAVGSTVVRALETAAISQGWAAGLGGRTSLFIYPPFDFHVVDAMLTNFHLPRSSLLMMVCALAGRDLIMRAYEEAIRERYRFYSYGDCMLIL